MILNGPGTYYFKVHGAKDAPLFRSVFEYEYFKNLLAKEDGCELIAYVFSEYQAQWVMHCEQDWQVSLDNIRANMQEQYFKIWHKHQQILSESAEVVLIEEDRYLVPLVMEMHYWPVREGLIARPEVYPWSSDNFYRQSRYQQERSATKLASHRMLQRLSKQRHNSLVCYERMMEQFKPWSIDDAKNRLYEAIASDTYIAMYLRNKKQQLSKTHQQIQDMHHQAETLVCNILGIPVEHIQQPRARRQYNQVEPLTFWLLLQSQCDIKQLAFIFDIDQTIIQGWERSIARHHPEPLLKKIQQRWQEKNAIKDSQLLSRVS